MITADFFKFLAEGLGDALPSDTDTILLGWKKEFKRHGITTVPEGLNYSRKKFNKNRLYFHFPRDLPELYVPSEIFKTFFQQYFALILLREKGVISHKIFLKMRGDLCEAMEAFSEPFKLPRLNVHAFWMLISCAVSEAALKFNFIKKDFEACFSKCGKCNHIFYAKKKGTIYCPKCKKKHAAVVIWRERNPLTHEEHECNYCHKIFIPKRKRPATIKGKKVKGWYCSDKCRVYGNRKMIKSSSPVPG